MAQAPDTREKVLKPHARYNAPAEVVVDPSLTPGQKQAALDNLEQDARRMEESAAEGMAGGRRAGTDGPSSDLHEVLEARDALAQPPVEVAYRIVIGDLRQCLANAPAERRHLVEQALRALEAHRSAIPTLTSGQPDPRSAQYQAEAREEAAKEKLDP